MRCVTRLMIALMATGAVPAVSLAQNTTTTELVPSDGGGGGQEQTAGIALDGPLRITSATEDPPTGGPVVRASGAGQPILAVSVARAELPDTLEGMISVALESSPLIAEAEAQVRLAEAQLKRGQLELTEKVAELYHGGANVEIEYRQKQSELEHQRRLLEKKVVSEQEVAIAELGLEQAAMERRLHKTRLETLTGLGLASADDDGQPAAKLPEKLEDIIAAALKTSPTMAEGEAQVELAQAQLNRARLDLAEQVTELFQGRQNLQIEVERDRSSLETLTAELRVGRPVDDEVRNAQYSLRAAEEALQLQETRLRTVLGIGQLRGSATLHTQPITAALGFLKTATLNPAAATNDGGAGRAASAPTPPPVAAPAASPIPEKFNEALDRPVAVSFSETPLTDMVDYFQSAAGENLVFVVHRDSDIDKLSITLNVPGKIPLRQAMTALADANDLVFVFRDYGILVTTSARSSQFEGPRIPADAPGAPRSQGEYGIGGRRR